MAGRYEIARMARLLATAGILLPLSSIATPVRAQDASAAPTGADDRGALQEIVVTAQRREQNLQEAPVAVTALSPDTLRQRNVTSTLELMQVTPGLQVSTQSGGGNSVASATFFLRGMGQQRANNGSEPAVGIYVDDIYYPSLQGAIFNIVDLERVEVLRGPQGTLFGRNTIGGAIRYTSSQPSRQFEGQVAATYGSYDRIDLTSYINIPIGDALAVRATAGHLERDGFVKVARGGPNAGRDKTDLVRLQVRADPSDNFRIDLSGQYMEYHLDGFPYTLPSPVAPLPGTNVFIYNASAAGRLNPYDSRYEAACKRCQPGTGFPEFADTEVFNASASLTWELSDAVTLKSLSGYTKVDSRAANDYDASILDIFHQNQSFDVEAFSQEFQLNAKLFDNRLNIVTGLYYYDERFISNGKISAEFIINNAITPATAITRDTESFAGFIDASFDVTDRLTLLLGGRYSRDKKNAAAVRLGVQTATAEASFPSTIARVGLKYRWSDQIMTYASISEGFRAGGFNYIPAQLKFFRFDPETSRAYEIGARMDLFDRHLRFNPTIFYNDWKNIQVQSVQAVPTGTIITLDNAGQAHTYGLEIETQLVVSDNLQLFGTLARLEAKYDSVGTASGITTNSKFMRAPELTYSLGATYTQEFAGGYSAVATVSYAWADDQVSTSTDTDFILLPSYGVANVRVEVTDPTKRYSLAVFGTNLTNEDYFIGGVRFSKNVGVDRADLGRPREFGVTLRAKF